MLALQEAIKKIVGRYIVGTMPLIADVSVGDTEIYIASTRRYYCNDQIALYDGSTFEGEIFTITNIPDKHTLQLHKPAITTYQAEVDQIQKLLSFETNNEKTMTSIYLGDPSIIPQFPAITIDAKSRNSEWLTLESIKQTYDIDITVYTAGNDYEFEYKLMHHFTKAIETALFRSFYPLVEPYDYALLTSDANDDDTLITVDNPDPLICIGGWVWLESYDYLRYNQIDEYLGNNVFKLRFPTGRPFSIGDKVIRPRRHFFNTMPKSTQYGTVNKGGFIKAGRIQYTASEENRLYTPFVDPLTF